MANILSQHAMLARLNIRAWTARQLDRTVTDQVNREHGASDDAGRYNKLLIPREALRPIEKLDGEIRLYFYSVTRPWHDEGARILPSKLFPAFSERMRDYRHKRESLVAEFAMKFPDYVQQRRRELNGMFRESDYPSQHELGRLFRMHVAIDTVPDSDDFRVQITENEAADIRREIQERSDAALATVMQSTWNDIAKVVGHMAKRLREYNPAGTTRVIRGQTVTVASGAFHASLVENVRELVALLPAFNLTNDPALADIAVRMEALTVEDSATLKASPELRENIAQTAESILKDVSAYLA